MNRGENSTKCSVWVVLGRLHRIAERLQSGQPVTARALAQREEVSRKTIHRSVDFLRDHLNWEIDGGWDGLRLVRSGKPILK